MRRRDRHHPPPLSGLRISVGSLTDRRSPYGAESRQVAGYRCSPAKADASWASGGPLRRLPGGDICDELRRIARNRSASSPCAQPAFLSERMPGFRSLTPGEVLVVTRRSPSGRHSGTVSRWGKERRGKSPGAEWMAGVRFGGSLSLEWLELRRSSLSLSSSGLLEMVTAS